LDRAHTDVRADGARLTPDTIRLNGVTVNAPDAIVDDLAATGARVLAAGATRFDFQPNSDHCFVYADPAGHPFCLSTWDGVQIDGGADGT
jgi:hypothetical protein